MVLRIGKKMKEFFDNKKQNHPDSSNTNKFKDFSIELPELYRLNVLLKCLKNCGEEGIIRTDYNHAVEEYEKGNNTISSFNLVYSKKHHNIYECDDRERKREWIIFK